MLCSICKRELNTGDNRAIDCGGDCWSCIEQIELELLPHVTQLEHWLIGATDKEKQADYEESRKRWRKLHNIPDKLQVKGSSVIPASYLK